MPVASQLALFLAHRENSASVRRCHSLAASGEMPSTSRSTELLRVRPTPTTFVRLVLMADVATGEDIYSIRPLWRRVKLFQSMSSLGEPLRGVKPLSARRVMLAPASLYPLAWGRAVSGRNSPVFLSRYMSPTSYVLHKKRAPGGERS